MKKSEITVSMPMTTYEEFVLFKKQYENLLTEMRDCFDFSNSQVFINFDINKAFELCKKFIPDRYKNANFIKTE